MPDAAEPILETPRLILRRLVSADAAALLRVWGDAEAMRYYPAPYTLSDVESLIARSIVRYGQDGYALWAMVLKSTGEVVGDCGPTRQALAGRDEVEIGWHVDPARQGQGLATEAGRACVDWAFTHTDAARVISFMGEDNAPSQAVARKVHAAFLGPCGERAGIPHVHFGTDREAWGARGDGRTKWGGP